VGKLRGGRPTELEAEYAAMAESIVEDPEGMIRSLAAGWAPEEQTLTQTPWVSAVAKSVAFGLSTGHVGMLEDGLRTVSPLEFDLADVRCPVRAIHGTIDDLEPYAPDRPWFPHCSMLWSIARRYVPNPSPPGQTAIPTRPAPRVCRSGTPPTVSGRTAGSRPYARRTTGSSSRRPPAN
jgi:hypothetical protein